MFPKGVKNILQQLNDWCYNLNSEWKLYILRKGIWMKKNIFLVAIMLSISFSLAGCGKKTVYDVISSVEEVLTDALPREEVEETSIEIASVEPNTPNKKSIPKVINYEEQYNIAMKYYEAEQYDEANEIFETLGTFQDSKALARECVKKSAEILSSRLIALGVLDMAKEVRANAGLPVKSNYLEFDYAKSQYEFGSDEAAYYHFADKINLPETRLYISYMSRPNGIVPVNFTDDSGTTYSPLAIYNDYDELKISLRFFRDDLLEKYYDPNSEEQYFFSEIMDNAWLEMCRRVKLVVNYNRVYYCTVLTGYPYCVLNEEGWMENEWLCWLSFDADLRDIEDVESAVVMYKDQIIIDVLDGISDRSFGMYDDYEYFDNTIHFDFEHFYTVAQTDFEVKNYAKAKKEFSCLYNYKKSDTYLDLLTTRECMKVYESLGLVKQADSARERLERLIKSSGLSIEY